MTIPRRDLDFHVHEVLETGSLLAAPRFSEHDRETLDGILDSAYRIAAERFAPFAAACDAHEPEFVDGGVRLIPETRAALDVLNESRFVAAPFPADVGGLQLPMTLSQACSAVFASANVGFHAYALLTAGAANVVLAYGTPEQQARYLGPMLEGRFFGTMCLSEPHAGSSLTDIRTEAVRQPDGTYRLRGTKMWISAGEHDLAENIIHLVLAKVPGGPPGVKGISLFIVPRQHVADDGTVGARNDVRLVGINHKMGWRGTVNTILEFGERGDCVGHLVGEEHHGLGYMFRMMNEARIGVGACAVALGYEGYLESLAYARTRPQGRPLSNKDPSSPPVAIIEHADVRRMLLAQKSFVEGGLDLVLYCARLVDEIATTDDAAARDRAHLLLELLTPICKSWPAEFCLEANKLAIQVLGGYGYTRDYPVERLYRDNRLNHIHEGTWAIHGLDLLGRKVSMQRGAALAELAARIERTVVAARGVDELTVLADSLAGAVQRVAGSTRTLLTAAAMGQAELAMANATLYLDAFGHVVVAWRWLAQALVAARALPDANDADKAFYKGKLAACRYFFRYELVKIGPMLELAASLDDTTVSLDTAGL